MEPLTGRELQTLIRDVKNSIGVMLGRDPSTFHVLTSKYRTPGDTFWLQVLVLQALERQVVEAGMDPTHPCFGPDIMGLISEVTAEQSEKGLVGLRLV